MYASAAVITGRGGGRAGSGSSRPCAPVIFRTSAGGWYVPPAANVA